MVVKKENNTNHYYGSLLKLYIDITPATQGSRIVMMLLIVIALAVLPGLIGDVSETLQKRRGIYICELHIYESTEKLITIYVAKRGRGSCQ